MEQMKADGEFVEFATFSGNLYGTSKAGVKNILESGMKNHHSKLFCMLHEM